MDGFGRGQLLGEPLILLAQPGQLLLAGCAGRLAATLGGVVCNEDGQVYGERSRCRPVPTVRALLLTFADCHFQTAAVCSFASWSTVR